MPTDDTIRTFIDRTPRAAPVAMTTTAPCPTCGGDKVKASTKGKDVENVCALEHTWLLTGKA